MIVVCFKLMILCCWGRRDAILTLTDGTEALMKHLSQDVVLLYKCCHQTTDSIHDIIFEIISDRIVARFPSFVKWLPLFDSQYIIPRTIRIYSIHHTCPIVAVAPKHCCIFHNYKPVLIIIIYKDSNIYHLKQLQCHV